MRPRESELQSVGVRLQLEGREGGSARARRETETETVAEPGEEGRMRVGALTGQAGDATPRRSFQFQARRLALVSAPARGGDGDGVSRERCGGRNKKACAAPARLSAAEEGKVGSRANLGAQHLASLSGRIGLPSRPNGPKRRMSGSPCISRV